MLRLLSPFHYCNPSSKRLYLSQFWRTKVQWDATSKRCCLAAQVKQKAYVCRCPLEKPEDPWGLRVQLAQLPSLTCPPWLQHWYPGGIEWQRTGHVEQPQSQPLIASSFILCRLPYDRNAHFNATHLFQHETAVRYPCPLPHHLHLFMLQKQYWWGPGFMLKPHSNWWAGVDVLLSTWMPKMLSEFQSEGCSSRGAESVYLLSPGVSVTAVPSACSAACGKQPAMAEPGGLNPRFTFYKVLF